MNTTSLASALDSLFGTISTCDSIFAKNGPTKGLISTANLASVLGVGGVIGVNQPGTALGSSDNLNSKPIGVYTTNPSTLGIPSNCPESVHGIFIGFGGGGSGSWGIQLFFPTSLSHFYFRTHVSSTFYSWNKVEV